MKIAIIGANGQLGCDLVEVFKEESPVLLTHKEIELSDQTSVAEIFKQSRPEIVINTAAFHNVPQCENEDSKAFGVNALGAKFLAENCLRNNSVLVQISTDYVFDGESSKPYSESDLTNPLNVYGITKLAGEHYIRSMMKRFFIIRTSGLYGINRCRGKNGNFIDTMLRLYREKKEIKVVNDEFFSPTYSLDLAAGIRGLLKTDYFGLFHVTNHGHCSWFEFANKLFELLKINQVIKPVKAAEFQSKVKRPAYSVLENSRLRELGLGALRPWQEALGHYLEQRRRLGTLNI